MMFTLEAATTDDVNELAAFSTGSWFIFSKEKAVARTFHFQPL